MKEMMLEIKFTKNNLLNKNIKMNSSQKRSAVSLHGSRRTEQMRGSTPKSSRSSKKPTKQNPQQHYNNSSFQPNISKVNMQMIFQANKQYLLDKIAIAEVPKPSKYYHKIPSKTPGTTYNNQFHKINQNLMNQLKLERKDNLGNQKNAVTDYKSLYGTNFDRKQYETIVFGGSNGGKGQRQAQYKPTQGPTFHKTSYHCDFSKNYNPIPTQSAKMKDVKLMGGGKFKGQSTYHQVYKTHNKKKQQPIHQFNNKIFMSIVASKQTTYENAFNSIKKQNYHHRSQTIDSECKSKEKKLASSDIKIVCDSVCQKGLRKTEYERSFQTVQARRSSNKDKKVNIMSLEEMKNLILNVL